MASQTASLFSVSALPGALNLITITRVIDGQQVGLIWPEDARRYARLYRAEGRRGAADIYADHVIRCADKDRAINGADPIDATTRAALRATVHGIVEAIVTEA